MFAGCGGLCETVDGASVTVTVFGGSSPSTPALFSAIARAQSTRKLEFRLVGRSAARLAAVARAAKLLVEGHPVSVETFLADADEEQWLCGADVVLIQARFGGLSGRLYDESFPLRYDLCGDEGLGPGGLSAAWRSWPPLRNLLGAIDRVAPKAFVILLTSPVSILTRLAWATNPGLRVAGICELPLTTLQGVCDCMGISLDDVRYSYSGLNHIGWFHGISLGSRDLVEEYAGRRKGAAFPSGELIRACGGIPLKYLRLHYEPKRVLAEQRTLVPRSAVLAEIADRAMKVFQQECRDAILEVLKLRPAPWYEQAVGPLLLALAGGEVSVPFFLSMAGAEGEVVETAYEFRNGGLAPIANASEPPAAIRETLEEFVKYEKVAGEAVLKRDHDQLAFAIEKHPWIRVQQVSTWELVQEITRSL